MDLVNGLGGPAGFGEGRGPFGDDDFEGPIDLRSVFPEGVEFFGRRFDSIFINSNGNLTFGDPFTSFLPEDISTLDRAGLYPFWSDVFVGDLVDPTPGGTSQGTNEIWYDLDPEEGAFTVTWDDVTPFDFDQDQPRNAFQIRLIDISDEDGRLTGDFRIELRYEAIEWTFGFGSAEESTARIGFTVGDGASFVELDASNDAELLSLLPQRGTLSFTFDAAGVSGGDSRPPIRGTDGDDVLSGTDGIDIFLPGEGADVIRPGPGADAVILRGGAKTISGTPEELLGDRLIGPGRDDLLFFEGVQFGPSEVRAENGGMSLVFDLDGDGATDGEIEIDQRIELGGAFAVSAAEGTHVGYLRDLPTLADGVALDRPDRFRDDAIAERFLTGDGSSDYTITYDAASTPAAGTALGVYSIAADGSFGDLRLLSTDIAGSARTSFTVEDVAEGAELGLFVLRSDADLSAVDSFAFVNQLGEAATTDDRNFIFAAADGAVIAGDLFHSGEAGLNQDLQSHAVIGRVPGSEGLTIGFEDEMFGTDGDFDDIIVTVERTADLLF